MKGDLDQHKHDKELADQREKDMNQEIEDLRAQMEEKDALIEKLNTDLLNADNTEEIEKELKKA